MKRLRFWHYDGDTNTMRTAYLRGKAWVMLAKWTDYCTGCTEYSDGYRISGPMGCEECGYTGKRRHAYWVPVDKSDQIVLNTRLRVQKARKAN